MCLNGRLWVETLPVSLESFREKGLLMHSALSWEQAVLWLRQDPNQAELVCACYYDDPLIGAAQRFVASEEWQATRAFFQDIQGRALDLGAGRGISSYALARDGWQVIALEPDPSAIVGAEAIRALAAASGLPIRVIEERAETLPFGNATFDLVCGRQVLHHARDLSLLCREAARVLKPRGRFIAVREHVLSKRIDLQVFLDNHPLHRLYGGENAYLLREYLSAIRTSGLHLLKILGPFDSPINYSPMTREEWRSICVRILARAGGTRAANQLLDERHALGRNLIRWMSLLASRLTNTPGRLYSFIMERPA
jgi:SAM-dependent methyltransferase